MTLLPPNDVRPFVRRNKTDRADAEALVDASRVERIPAVPIKRAEQQALVGLHRVREQWMTTRTARINALRGLLQEHGLNLPPGAKTAVQAAPALLESATALPAAFRRVLASVQEEIHALEDRIAELDRELRELAAADPVCALLQTVPGIGLPGGWVTLRDRHALRHRPDHIVGDDPGAEAADLLQALDTGHGGSLATVHANSVTAALSRLAPAPCRRVTPCPGGSSAAASSTASRLSFTGRERPKEPGRVAEMVRVCDYDAHENRWRVELIWPAPATPDTGEIDSLPATSSPDQEGVGTSAEHDEHAQTREKQPCTHETKRA